MATKRFKELKNLSDAELAIKLTDLESQLFQLRMKRAINQSNKTADAWKMRKDIARIKMLTAMKSQQIAGGK